MPWSYDPTALATSQKDQVRFEIADTDESNQLLQDEEIVYALGVEADLWGAAARCCETLSRGFLRKADVQLGRQLKIDYTKQAQQYTDMAKGLRGKSFGGALPYVGGRSKQEKIDRANDLDAVQPLFAKNMDRNPYAGGVPLDEVIFDDGEEVAP